MTSLDVQVALIKALIAQRKTAGAQTLTARIEPLLQAADTPYAVELRERLAAK